MNKKEIARLSRKIRPVFGFVNGIKVVRALNVNRDEDKFWQIVKEMQLEIEEVVKGHCPSHGDAEGDLIIKNSKGVSVVLGFGCTGIFVRLK